MTAGDNRTNPDTKINKCSPINQWGGREGLYQLFAPAVPCTTVGQTGELHMEATSHAHFPVLRAALPCPALWRRAVAPANRCQRRADAEGKVAGKEAQIFFSSHSLSLTFQLHDGSRRQTDRQIFIWTYKLLFRNEGGGKISSLEGRVEILRTGSRWRTAPAFHPVSARALRFISLQNYNL